ncbi:hypothetical protein THAOC_27411, partial [Thalassiosira oceanica]
RATDGKRHLPGHDEPSSRGHGSHVVVSVIGRRPLKPDRVNIAPTSLSPSSPPSGPAPHPLPGEIYSKDTPRQRKLLQLSHESELGRMEAQIALSAWHQESGDCPVVVVVVNVRDYGEKGRYETGPQTNDRASSI